MSDVNVEGHVLYSLRNARVNPWPFPHFYAENVFPDETYWKIYDYVSKKGAEEYTQSKNNYNGRLFAKDTDEDITFLGLDFLKSEDFLRHVVKIFRDEFSMRFTDYTRVKLSNDLRLIRDGRDYSIGPHTDAPHKVVSMLFYLPLDGWNHDCGTSIYLPKDRSFRCAGGPHRKFEDFDKIFTAPFLPNTCLGFFKTDYSFHGVEKIEKDFQRDVLLYNVYHGNINSLSSE